MLRDTKIDPNAALLNKGNPNSKSSKQAVVKAGSNKQSPIKSPGSKTENKHGINAQKCRLTVQQDFAMSECENQVFMVWVKQGDEKQVKEMSANESGQCVMGNVVFEGVITV